MRNVIYYIETIDSLIEMTLGNECCEFEIGEFYDMVYIGQI